jgi:hypothetical protein
MPTSRVKLVVNWPWLPKPRSNAVRARPSAVTLTGMARPGGERLKLPAGFWPSCHGPSPRRRRNGFGLSDSVMRHAPVPGHLGDGLPRGSPGWAPGLPPLPPGPAPRQPRNLSVPSRQSNLKAAQEPG